MHRAWYTSKSWYAPALSFITHGVLPRERGALLINSSWSDSSITANLNSGSILATSCLTFDW